MNSIFQKESFALLTDFYELTMAYGYWKRKMIEHESVFHLFFRRLPFHGGFCLTAGLNSVIRYLNNYRFDESDLLYIRELKLDNGKPFFEEAFVDYLSKLHFNCDIDALPEGSVVFPYEPMLRVQGPLIQCQLLESPLLNLTNFASLIATKAARICLAAKGDPVIEFGLRRAQGIDGAITATRSAYIGGCVGTSNTFAGKILGIPAIGTHAHSWIMAFDTELESFQNYAEAMPDNCIFLVDTYDSLEGVRNAIEVGKWLKAHGKKFLGIRLDSGDLTYLSVQSRKMLDKAGFSDAKILASNELDELIISDLKQQGAQVSIWGVGTHLVTGQGSPALDGVYKLSGIKKPGRDWEYKIKLSENMAKISNPGIMQIRRYFRDQHAYADMIFHEGTDLSKGSMMIDPFDPTKTLHLSANLSFKDLLKPIFRKGKLVYEEPSLDNIQKYAKDELAHFDPSIKRSINPHIHPVGMEKSLYDLKRQLIEQIRSKTKQKKRDSEV